MPLDKITKIHANGAAIAPSMVFAAVVAIGRDGVEPAYARAHPAQIASWLYCALTVNTEIKAELAGDELPAFPPTNVTLGGIPLKEDPKLFPDRVVYHSADGKAVGRIIQLAIPVGYEYPAVWNCNSKEAYEERLEREGWLFE